MFQQQLTADEIVLLGQELQALFQAGIPLEQGLRDLSKTGGSRLDEMARDLADRLEQGVPLEEALKELQALPASFRAVLLAGIRCGKSREALQEFTDLDMALQQWHRSAFQAVIYPLVLLGLAIVLFVGTALVLAPGVLQTYHVFRFAPPTILKLWSLAGTGAGIALAGGLLVMILFLLWSQGLIRWFISPVARLLGLTPLDQEVALARLSRLLSILMHYEVPLPEALKLTAECADSPRWRDRLLNLERSMAQGLPLSSAVLESSGFPRFFCWLIAGSLQSGRTWQTFRQVSTTYLEKAIWRAELLTYLIPGACVALFGGSIVALYGFTVFGTLIDLWEQLAQVRR
jgi:type II secretory pathway component PulF